MMLLITCGCGWYGELKEWAAVHKCSAPRAPLHEPSRDSVCATPEYLTPREIQLCALVRIRAGMRVV